MIVREMVIVVFALALASCVPQNQARVAQREQQAQTTAVLLETWFVRGQPPQTVQTEMTDLTSCERAKVKAIAAGEDARKRRVTQNQADRQQAIAQVGADCPSNAIGCGPGPGEVELLKGVPVPDFSAVCISR